MARALFWGVVAALLAGGLYVCFWRERPYVLIRFSATKAIEATAEFQHKTKLFFEIGQAEGAIPGACHNFEFSPEKISIFKDYLATGAMQFFPYRNQQPPFGSASAAALDLSIGEEHLLVDNIDACKAREVKEITGAYELSLGKAVVEVTGIKKEGNRASADFEWHFESLNKVGQALPRITVTKQLQIADARTTPQEKLIAPFWLGSAELTKYDDGWRVMTVNLSSSKFPWGSWDYGPEWPDESFDWHTFDEHENRLRAKGTPNEQ